MNLDPTAELYKAIRALLIADATVNGFVAGRVYSDWSANAGDPLIRLSVPLIEDYDDDCGAGGIADIRVHVFAKGGPVARSQLAGAVRSALQDTEPVSTEFDIEPLTYIDTINTQDPDDPNMFIAVVRFTASATAIP